MEYFQQQQKYVCVNVFAYFRLWFCVQSDLWWFEIIILVFRSEFSNVAYIGR